MAELIAAISSSLIPASACGGCKLIRIRDINVVTRTSAVKNTKTVPMPTSISVIP